MIPSPLNRELSITNAAHKITANISHRQFVPLNPRPMLQGLYVPACSSVPGRPHVSFTLPPLVRTAGGIKIQLTELFHLILLLARINEDIIVRLKWGHTEYRGRLVSVDSYMNLQLSNTEEFIDGKSTGSLGQVLIRLVLRNSLFSPLSSLSYSVWFPRHARGFLFAFTGQGVE